MVIKMALSNDRIDIDIQWRWVWFGYGAALVGTLVLGGELFLAYENLWWVALASIGVLFLAGIVVGFKAKSAEPLNGAFIAVFYFATVAAVLFGGELIGRLPDPLPGLPRGDSTFFFVWPLGQLAAATLGAVLGGWIFSTKRRR